MRLSLIATFVFGCIALTGCTHDMRIINSPDRPFVSTALDEPVIVGVVNQGGYEGEGYVDAVARALITNGNVERVVYPYAKGHKVDVIAYVDPRPVYHGSWVNFFVDWPGFLIWTPAWHGYNYRADISTHVDVKSAQDSRSLGMIDWQHVYKFRQADIGRSWVEVGWFEVSLIPFIGGFFAIGYDEDQTQPFIREVSHSYGNQVAARMMSQIQP